MMQYATDELLNKIIERLNQEGIKHEVHKFLSGAVMIDIWKGGLLHVIQIGGTSMGLSLNVDNTAFDTIPDKRYFHIQDFLNAFEECIRYE